MFSDGSVFTTNANDTSAKRMHVPSFSSQKINGRFLVWCSSLFLALTLSACTNRIEWNEEVLLQGGEKVVVHRTARTAAFGEVGGPGGWENKGMTLLVIQPESPTNPPLWDARFVPLLFDREPITGQWYVVATFYSCTSWYDLGRPSLPYTEFRLEGDQWVQHQLTQDFIGRKANLLTSINSKGEPNHTLASKRWVMEDLRISKEYKEVVSHWKTGC